MKFFCFLPSMGLGEWVVILLIVLVFFGGKRVSGVFRGLGEGVREFKKGIKEEDDKENKPAHDNATQYKQPTDKP